MTAVTTADLSATELLAGYRSGEISPVQATRDALDRIEEEGQAQIDLGGRPVTIGRDFVRDVKAQELAPIIGSLKKALLVLMAS